MTVGAVARAIAAAAHLAGHDRGAQRVFGPPIGGVERRVREEPEEGVVFDEEVALEAADRRRRLGVRWSRWPSRST